MQRLFIRDFQLHAAVDDIAFQSVQTDDLLVAAAVAEVLLGDSPEGVAMHHGMNIGQPLRPKHSRQPGYHPQTERKRRRSLLRKREHLHL